MIPYSEQKEYINHPKVQQKRRELKLLGKQKTEFLGSDLLGEYIKSQWYGNENIQAAYKDFAEFERKMTQREKMRLFDESKKIKAELKAEKQVIAGDAMIFDLSSLYKEKEKIRKRLYKFDKQITVKIGKKEKDGKEFAQKKSLDLYNCSSLLVFNEQLNGNDKKLLYRNACKSRICPICSHYASRTAMEQLQDSLQQKIEEMYATEDGRKRMTRGRLVHIVLTTESLMAERVLEVKNAWRFIQQRKDRNNVKKSNPHEVWRNLTWGMWRWEATYNEQTHLWHSHLHILAWADGWLATGGNGWWTKMQESWALACAHYGIVAAINGSQEVNGAKVQHIGEVIHFTKSNIDKNMEDLRRKTIGAVLETTKYLVKSSDLLKCSDDVQLVTLLATIQGRVLMAGWGGLKLDPEEKPLTKTELQIVMIFYALLLNESKYIDLEVSDVEDETRQMTVYRFSQDYGIYQKTAEMNYNRQVMNDFLSDLSNYDIRQNILDNFENLYIEQQIKRKKE